MLFISFLLFTLTGKAQVVINELGIAPTTGNGGGGEFIELFNKGGCAVDISCYVLVFSSTSGGGNATGWTITIPSGKSIAACGYFLIGGAGIQGSSTSSWGNSPIGGSLWINNSGTQGNNTADLDVSTSSNSSKQSLVPGTLSDPQGQVTLYSPAGVVISSVSYNTGNNALTYSAISNRPAGCTGISSFSNPGQSSKNVTGSSFVSGATNRQRGIYLDANGNYQPEINFTPGKQNNLAGGTQLACAPTITTASATSDVCYSTAAQTTTLAYSAVTNTPVTYSIVWDAAPANSFLNVTNDLLPASPIIISVPGGTLAGTYTGNITVTNSSGVISCPTISFTVTVKPKPSNPTITHN